MFPCTKCGECCRHMERSELTAHLDGGDGTCRHFDEAAAACAIYADRPVICRIDACYERFFRQEMGLDEFYRLNADACNEMQEEAGLPERFRVKP